MEEFTFDKNGRRSGPAKLTKPDGSVEHRQYKNGAKNGPALLKMADGNELKFEYVNDEVVGESR